MAVLLGLLAMKTDFQICAAIVYCLLLCHVTSESLEDFPVSGNERFRLEGKVVNQHTPEKDKDWILGARVLVDGGQYLSMLKADGSFAVNNVPSGSYVVEVVHPKFFFEPVRVEINSKGKIRARALNYIQPSSVNVLSYPLRIRSRGKTQYFQQRDQWRVSDFIFNPMILMMVVPFLCMFILPKLMNSQDPETQKEMQKSMNLLSPKQSMPDMSEWLTQMFKGNGASSSSKKPSKPNKSLKKQN